MKADPAGKLKLTGIIGYCFNTLRTYGKEPEQMDAANKMFQFVLSDYPIDKISEAFRYYFSIATEMPTPADIVNIIRRGNKPPLERSVYVNLSKKPADTRTSDEWAYMREWEEFIIHG